MGEQCLPDIIIINRTSRESFACLSGDSRMTSASLNQLHVHVLLSPSYSGFVQLGMNLYNWVLYIVVPLSCVLSLSVIDVLCDIICYGS